jgi:subfamily B ATP-binding cassette protein MsbA
MPAGGRLSDSAPLIVYPLVRLGQRVRRTTTTHQEAQEQMAHVSAEALTGHRIVKAFGAEAREAASSSSRPKRFYRTSMRVTSVLSVLPPLMEMIGGVALRDCAVGWEPGNRGEAFDAGRLRRHHHRAVPDVRAGA